MAVLRQISGLLDDDDGATAVEYALIAAGIAAVIVVVVYVLGNHVNNSIAGVANKMP
jgi:pilus assembly protein Flp/PilA